MLPKTERPDIMRSLPTRLWSGLMVTNDTFSTVDDGMFCVELILPFISTIAVTENLRKTLDKCDAQNILILNSGSFKIRIEAYI